MRLIIKGGQESKSFKLKDVVAMRHRHHSVEG